MHLALGQAVASQIRQITTQGKARLGEHSEEQVGMTLLIFTASPVGSGHRNGHAGMGVKGWGQG